MHKEHGTKKLFKPVIRGDSTRIANQPRRQANGVGKIKRRRKEVGRRRDRSTVDDARRRAVVQKKDKYIITLMKGAPHVIKCDEDRTDEPLFIAQRETIYTYSSNFHLFSDNRGGNQSDSLWRNSLGQRSRIVTHSLVSNDVY